jgi:hypothetical protein
MLYGPNSVPEANQIVYWLFYPRGPLSGEDRSSTFLLSCAPNAEMLFIEVAPADSQVTQSLMLTEGPSAARTDIGPRRTPNARMLIALASLRYLVCFLFASYHH